MKEVSHTEGLLSEEQLQDISGGCSNCELLRQARKGFQATADYHRARAANTYLSSNRTAAEISEGEAETNALHVRTINNALAQIKHVK